jgi:hypothetical protein
MHHSYTIYIISISVVHIFHHITLINIIDLIQNIIIMYHIGLSPSTVMHNRSNQQMLMPYIPILSTILTSLQSTIIIALSRYNMVNRNHSAHHYHNHSAHHYHICSFHWLIYSADKIDMMMNTT